MALDLVIAGDPIIPDDVNQYYVFLNGINGQSTLVKEFTGSISASGVATIPHGLGRLPYSLIGYYSATSLSAVDTDGLTIHGRGISTTGNVVFAHSNVGTIKSADNTNVWVRNGTAGTIYYKVYVI